MLEVNALKIYITNKIQSTQNVPIFEITEVEFL
jgi:hypothetical protein